MGVVGTSSSGRGRDGHRVARVRGNVHTSAGHQGPWDTPILYKPIPNVTQLKGMEWRSRRQNGRKWPLTQSSRAKLVVLAVEVGGRWSGGFLSQLARAHEKKLHSSDVEQSKPGDSGGVRCLDVLLRRWWPRHC